MAILEYNMPAFLRMRAAFEGILNRGSTEYDEERVDNEKFD